MSYLRNPFPSARVQQLLGVVPPKHSGNTVPCKISYTQLLDLLDMGATTRDEQQNNAPSVGDFLDYFKDVHDKLDKFHFTAYVVFPPRDDARVSVEGFEATTSDQKLLVDLIRRFHKADELDFDGNNIYAWWD